MAGPVGARERVALVADGGQLEPWDEDVVSDDPLRFADALPYRERLAAARERTGLGEAVLTGLVHVQGRPLAVVAGEFGFLGGSVGVATGERVGRAMQRAVERRLPLLALPASGGTRMQEGAPALMQMARLAGAARRLRDAGLAYLVCLNDPTTGGVLASWGSLGTVTWATPGALLGFGGPRVVEMLTGAPLPEGIQRAEHLLERGLIDDVVAPADLRERVARVLAVTEGSAPSAWSPVAVAAARRTSGSAPSVAPGSPGAPPPSIVPGSSGEPSRSVAPESSGAPPPSVVPGSSGEPSRSVAPESPGAPLPSVVPGSSGERSRSVAPEPPVPRDAWASVGHARNPARPSAAALLAAWGTDVTVLRGDRAGGGDDRACLAALARVRGIPTVVVAQARDPVTRVGARMGPAGYRKALRAMLLAGELGLPLVTIVDTPGAQMSVAAEEGGLSLTIAQCLAQLAIVPVPTLAVLAGEGGSGGALALLAADRVVCAEHAGLHPIAPEGASAILYRDTAHAAELAATQGGASWDLARRGVVDVVVAEHPSADREPDAFAARLGDAVEAELRALLAQQADERLAARARRYRHAA